MIKRALFCGLSLVSLAGCPETVGQQCPSGSVQIGQYKLSFAAADAGSDECRLTQYPDGGPADASLVQTDAATQDATLCAGPGDAGAIALTLAIPTKGLRTTDLEDGGAFAFTSHTVSAQGTTVCSCPLAVDETFSGSLSVPGGFALLADGGMPYVTGVTGMLTDQFSTPTPPCTCNVPCVMQYSVTGARF